MRSRRVVVLAILALVGVTASVAIAFAASRISDQHIGLNSQQRSVATQALAPTETTPTTAKPHATKHPKHKRSQPKTAEPVASTDVTVLPVTPRGDTSGQAEQSTPKSQSPYSGKRLPTRTVTNVNEVTTETPTPDQVVSTPSSTQPSSNGVQRPQTSSDSSEPPAPTPPTATQPAPAIAPKTTTADD